MIIRIIFCTNYHFLCVVVVVVVVHSVLILHQDAADLVARGTIMTPRPGQISQPDMRN